MVVRVSTESAYKQSDSNFPCFFAQLRSPTEVFGALPSAIFFLALRGLKGVSRLFTLTGADKLFRICAISCWGSRPLALVSSPSCSREDLPLLGEDSRRGGNSPPPYRTEALEPYIPDTGMDELICYT